MCRYSSVSAVWLSKPASNTSAIHASARSGLGAGSSPTSTRHQRSALRITSPPLTSSTRPDSRCNMSMSSRTSPTLALRAICTRIMLVAL